MCDSADRRGSLVEKGEHMEHDEADVRRATAGRYELLEAIDLALAPDFAATSRRVELLERMVEAWLAVPAFERLRWPNQTGELMSQLDRARLDLFEDRHWNWTRRVAGYGAGAIAIEEA